MKNGASVYLSGMENEYQPKCSGALRQVWFIPLVDKRVGRRKKL